MGFWILAAIMCLLVSGLLALALLRRTEPDEASDARDIGVYRDQLADIERDVERGVLAPEEAERVRIEISRRILEADKSASGADVASAAPRWSRTGATLAVVLAVLGGGLGLYAAIGAPGYGDMPLAGRIEAADEAHRSRPAQAAQEAALGRVFSPPANADPGFLELMARLREAVAQNPEDLRGQELMARNEAGLGNFTAAHAAQARVIALKGPAATADDHAIHGELMVLATQGYVSPEAEAAFRRALDLMPTNGSARYYLGLMHAQSARPDLAFPIWRQLLSESPVQAPWIPPILAQIAQVADAAGIRYTPPTLRTPALPGPSADDIAAAEDMTSEDRAAMIRGMVEGLAARLATDGGTAEDWARLIGSLGVLGDTERAAAIWAEAQQVFADAPEAVETIRQAARAAGVAP